MLDDKKINELIDNIFENKISSKYSEIKEDYPHGSLSCLYDEDTVKNAMKTTIQEYLKDLWHPASEEPKESVNVIAEVYLFRGIKTYIRFKRNDKSFAIWNNGNTDAKVIRWLYIDDLLPKQKGGSDD